MFNFGNSNIMLDDGFEIVYFSSDFDFIVKDKYGKLYICYISVKDTEPTLSTKVLGG